MSLRVSARAACPPDSAPTSLVVEDITAGTGKEATAGSTITVHYVGVAFSTKSEFDASWNTGQPFTFHSMAIGSLSLR